MKLHHAVGLALKGVSAKPSRMFLTLLGIAIGVSAVMVIVALGNSTEELILGEIRGLGADTFVIQAGREVEGPNDFTETLLSDSLKEKDVEALRKKANAPHIIEVAPLVVVPGSVSYGNDTFQPQIIGGNADFFSRVYDVYPEQGVPYGEEEDRQKAFVAVIGSQVKQELFGESDALGEKITIKGQKFRVVGVLPKKGQVAFLNFDETIFVPASTAQTYLLGISHYFEFVVRVDDPENLDRTTQDVEITLRESHGLEEGEVNDFKVRTPEALVEQIGTILSILTIFLSSVVGIALVVGGVGIMNIMLVSVAERTREIGLRKAVGATDTDIMLQFLLEAVLLTLFGGVAGVLAGGLIAYGASAAIREFSSLSWVFVFPWSAAFGALVFSAVIGLVFGIYPARKASRKSPMEALRYE